ncbi:MAG: universal stress protein, partial [Gammaproteobacteria bacterium]|nr:universal stress protein [Gammaproteobacteria bacterium]
KVLLPIDIFQPHHATLKTLAGLVPLTQADVHLLYVREDLPSYEKVLESAGDFKEDFSHQVDEKAKKVLEQVANELKPICKSVSSEVVAGTPALMIETVARDEKCDITVLTPGHNQGIEIFFLGSVASKVVKHGPNTILISREYCNGSDSNNAERKVLIAIDGSQQALEALSACVPEFGLGGNQTQIELIHVVNVADALKLVSPVEYISIVENNLLLEGETFLADAQKKLADLGVRNVSCKLKEGDPASEIINYAKEIQAQLVICGAKGRTAVQHFLLGSVSHRIAMHAPCSVAVVKAAKN